jgi:hypothetical protein
MRPVFNPSLLDAAPEPSRPHHGSGAVGATDSSPRTWQHGARAWLPSPLAGEGLGERGVSAKAPEFPPLPNPSPARGEGLKSVRFGCGSRVGG